MATSSCQRPILATDRLDCHMTPEQVKLGGSRTRRREVAWPLVAEVRPEGQHLDYIRKGLESRVSSQPAPERGELGTAWLWFQSMKLTVVLTD